MHLSPSSISAKADEVTVSFVERQYHESLGIVRIRLGDAGTLYLDFDTAAKVQENLNAVMEEYLGSDVATYNTYTLDAGELEES